jgi:hypothetical protein
MGPDERIHGFPEEEQGEWKERKIEESKRIKEEDKKDRLAIVKEKKTRYGIKVLSR